MGHKASRVLEGQSSSVTKKEAVNNVRKGEGVVSEHKDSRTKDHTACHIVP